MSGIKHDHDKPRWDLVPYDGLEGTVEALTFGANKYSDRNWEEGMRYGRCFAAAMRHLTAWWGGETNDPESGLNHLHHAACCILFLQAFAARGEDGKQMDDRPAMVRAAEWIFADSDARQTTDHSVEGISITAGATVRLKDEDSLKPSDC